MKKATHRRRAIKPPKSTNTVSASPAHEDRLRHKQRQDLRKQLKAVAIANAERDLAIAKDWCHIEEESWQKWLSTPDRHAKQC